MRLNEGCAGILSNIALNSAKTASQTIKAVRYLKRPYSTLDPKWPLTLDRDEDSPGD